MASLAQTKKVQNSTYVSPLVQSAANKTTSQKSSTPGTSMGGNVSAPTTVYTTSAATRSANARNAGAGSSNAATVNPQSVIKPGNTLDYTPLNQYNTVSEYTDGGWYGGDTNALAEVYKNANVPYTPTTNTGGGGNGVKTQQYVSNSGVGNGGGYSYGDAISAISVDPTQAVRNRYANLLSELLENHNTMRNALKQNYDAAVNTVNNNYNLSEQEQNANAEEAFRQAYINMMLNNKHMDSDMARLGYNGGVTESNRARMYNNYGNIRNDISKNLANNIAQINARRTADLADVLANYNTNLANQEKNYFNERSSYQEQLSKALAAMGY